MYGNVEFAIYLHHFKKQHQKDLQRPHTQPKLKAERKLSGFSSKAGNSGFINVYLSYNCPPYFWSLHSHNGGFSSANTFYQIGGTSLEVALSQPLVSKKQEKNNLIVTFLLFSNCYSQLVLLDVHKMLLSKKAQ